ncbi:MAG: beta strand repeat-containing protein, partial [Flavobacteriia bacterium]
YQTPTTATVGSTQNICGSLVSASLGGNTPSTGTGLWSIVSGGTGTFSSASSGTSTFTANAYGTYVLRWTISNGTCAASTADVTVNYYQTPTTATVGSTQNICGSLVSASLGGNTPSSGTGLWSIVSGGTGTFSSASSGTSTFTANAYGTYVLRWTISNGTCAASTADVTVNYYQTPTTVSVSPTTGTYCGTVTLIAANGNDGTIYFQGTNANGTSTATPSTSEVITTSGTYYFNALNANGCWSNSGSAVITITPATITSNAGSDQTQCGNGSFTLAGNAPTSGTGLWSITSGTASISSPSSPTSAVTGVPAGTSATLRWTVTDGPCLIFDEVILTNNSIPAMTSVSSLTICSGEAVGLNLTSSVPASYSWVATSSSTVDGESTSSQSSGTVSDILTNISTSASADQSVTYTVTPTALIGGCPGSAQTLTITVRRPLMVAISGSQVACGATVNEVLTASATAGVTGYQWYLNGTSISGATSSTYTATANGTYSVEISNAGGCSVTSGNYTVTLPSALSVSVSGTNVTCSGANDGQATVTFSGGLNRKLINFDNALNWVAGGAALSSYSNHSYNESDWVITAVNQGLQESMFPITQEPSVLGTYAWRLNSTPTTNHLLFTYNGTKEVSGFGFKARAYSNMPNWSVEYSINGGTSWNALSPVINAASLGNQNGWTNFDYVFPSPLSLATGQLKIRIIRQAS